MDLSKDENKKTKNTKTKEEKQKKTKKKEKRRKKKKKTENEYRAQQQRDSNARYQTPSFRAVAMYQFFPDSGMEHKNLGSIRLLSLALNSNKGSDAQCLDTHPCTSLWLRPPCTPLPRLSLGPLLSSSAFQNGGTQPCVSPDCPAPLTVGAATTPTPRSWSVLESI